MINKYYKIAKFELFNLCRSITGQGTKKTLQIIKKNFPKLKIFKVKSGTKVYDWKIPPEWRISDAYVLDKNNNKIIDFKINNLHLVGYSVPKRIYLSKKDFLKKLHTLPKKPNAIPYVTSYYKRNWGFCVTEYLKKKIINNYKSNDKFFILINSNLNRNGFLRYGEYIIKGKSQKEILISTYICHPSMANNELSGIIVSMALINYFKRLKSLNYTLRFLFIPETIGSITYLFKNLDKLKRNVIGGYNLSCIGDERLHSCMLSKYENSPSDFALLTAYKKLNLKKKIYSFLKRGSDERQFNSPGIDLGITSIFRSKYGEYPEYHTSLDNFLIVTKKGLKGGFQVAKTAIQILQKKIIPKNNFFCEPNMGKRKLYPTLSVATSKNKNSRNLMNFITYSDGKNDLETISKIIKINLTQTKKIYNLLKDKKIIF